MRLLLDSHALIWWTSGDRPVSDRVRDLLAEPSSMVFVSAAVAWEIATKFRLGKLPIAENLVENFDDVLMTEGFLSLDITSEHALLAGQIDAGVKDPFDRMIAAQARVEKLKVVTIDPAIKTLGAETIW